MPDSTGGWVAGKTGANALSDQTVRAAPGAGLYLNVRKVVFNNEGTANTFLLEYDSTAVYPPDGVVYVAANATFVDEFPHPIKLAANKALTVTTTAADASTTVVHGFTSSS